MPVTYTTQRGQLLDTFRDNVETVVLTYREEWRSGPVNHTLYAAVIRGFINGEIPIPPAE